MNDNAKTGGRILFAEDDDIVSDTIRSYLEGCGYQVSHAADGAAAWELFQKNPGAFDMLLTDLKMPHMSGFELVSKIRGLPSQLKIMVLSGYLDDREMDRLYDLAVDDILSKPVRPEELNNHVQRLINA